MKQIIKKIGFIFALSFSLFFTTACTPEQEALATGAIVGAVAGAAIASYSKPYYYDNRPYYYHSGRYYYGGRYNNGYYYYNGRRFRNGHYYRDNYRYYNGRRYTAQSGRYGYYNNNRSTSIRYR